MPHGFLDSVFRQRLQCRWGRSFFALIRPDLHRRYSCCGQPLSPAGHLLPQGKKKKKKKTKMGELRVAPRLQCHAEQMARCLWKLPQLRCRSDQPRESPTNAFSLPPSLPHQTRHDLSRVHSPWQQQHLYNGKSKHEAPPHIYAVADAAFHSLRDSNKDQCCVVRCAQSQPLCPLSCI
jgi:hypothetical protein